MQTLAMPKTKEPWSLTSLREKLIKLGANIVSHGRFVTFQSGRSRGVAADVRRNLFADRRLQAAPAPALEASGMERARITMAEGRLDGGQATSSSVLAQAEARFSRLPARAPRDLPLHGHTVGRFSPTIRNPGNVDLFFRSRMRTEFGRQVRIVTIGGQGCQPLISEGRTIMVQTRDSVSGVLETD
jgi:hypothetical protein